MAWRQGPRVRLSLSVLLAALAALLWTGTAVAANGTIQIFKGGDRATADTDRGYAANVQGAFFEYTTDAAKAADPDSTGWTTFGPTNASGAASVSVPESTGAAPAYYVREAAVPVGFIAFGPVKALSFSDDTSEPVGTAPYAARVRVEPGETTNVTPNRNRTANPVNWELNDPDADGDGSPFVNVRDNTSFPESCGVDMLLVLDRSGSIDPFRTEYRDAAQAFVNSLVGTPTTLGMISFAATTATYADGTADNREQSPLSLLLPANATALNTAIANVYAAPAGGTNWDSALEAAANAKGFPAAVHPAGQPDVVVFITDGNPTVRTGSSTTGAVDLFDLTFGVASANLVKNQLARTGKNVKMYAIGVGTGVNPSNLRVVSGPTAGEDYESSSIDGLKAKLAELSSRLCGARVFVRKKLAGNDAEQPGWRFSGSRTGSGTISYLDNNQATHVSGANIQTGVLVPSVASSGEQVSVAEDAAGQPLTDFALSNVTCRADGYDTGAVVTPAATSSLGVTLNVQRGSTSYCTFTNAPRTPNLTIVKTPDGQTIDAGDDAVFSITVGNTGTAPARGVTLSDPLPAGGTWTENSADCAIATGTMTCSFGDLAPGATRTVQLRSPTSATQCAAYDNTATVQATNNPAASDSGQITCRPAAVSVTKTADAADVSAGDQIGFTVTLANSGTGTARGLQFTDVLPSGLAWSISPASSGWSIQGQNLVFAPTTLAGGASTTVHVVATTDAGDCGQVDNTATLTTSNDGSDSESASVDVLCADIDVDKTADAPSITAGDEIGFTVTLSNTGEGEARGVQFTDPLPAGLDWSISPASAGWSIQGDNLVYSPTTLAGGASTTVHVVAATGATDCGQVDNTATVTTTNDGSDSEDAAVDVNCATIDVAKVADDDSVTAGDQIGFTVTLANTGDGQARGVEFTDVLPAGFAWSISPASAGWSIDGQNLVFAPSTLAAGASTSVHVIATSDAGDCGEVSNTAAVTTSNDGDDSDTAVVDVNCAAVDVDKTADAENATAGDQIGFTVTLRNLGEGEARGVQFIDPLPAGLSWSISPASAGWSIADGNLVYSPATLAPGAVTTVHVVATTDGTDCGQVDNLAAVTTSNDGSDSEDASIDVSCGQIDVQKVADDERVSAGDQIGFTVTLANTGDGEARGIQFTDVLPAGLSWSISPASAGWSIQGQNLVYTPTTLAAGASTAVHVIATTDAPDCGEVENTASVTTANEGSDTDSDAVDVLCADIDIDKTADAESVSAGDQIGFTVTLSNAGEGEANGLQVTDPLPAGLDWSISPASAGWSIADGNLVYSPATLAGGASTTVHVVATTDAGDCGQVDNTATVTTTNDGSDSEDASVDVNCADIDVEKVADDPSVSAGEQIGFTVTLSNTGEGEAHGIEFTDVLPSGLNWSIDPLAAGWSIEGPNLVYSPTTLAGGASTSVHVVAATDAGDCGEVANTATVTTANDGSDTDSDSVDVLCPAIDVDKTADAESASAGDQVGFTVTLRNTGEGQATGVEFTDALPAGLAWSISPASAGWSIEGGNLVYGQTTLDAGEVTTVHVVATTDAGDCGQVDNVATVTTTNDGSDSEDASVDVNCADTDVEKVADDDSVTAGDQIGFTVTLANTGEGEARGIGFTDVLPAGLSWSISPASAGWSIAGQNLVFAPTTLAAGATSSVHVIATTDAADCGDVSNTAAVTTTNDGDDSDTAVVDVNCGAIEVDKTADADSVVAGDQIGFTVTLRNTGEGEARGIQFADALPGDLSWSISPASAGWSIADGNLVYSPATLAPGGMTTVHVVAATDDTDCGQLDNTATVSTANAGQDTASDSADVDCAELDVEKVADDDEVTAGDQIGFTVTLGNTGTGEARGIAFSDPLPVGFDWSISPESEGWSIQGGALVFAPTTLPAGSSTFVHVVATTDAADCGVVENTASVTSANDGDDSDTATVDVNCAAIELEKVADADAAVAGSPIGFTLTATNGGTGEARGVVIEDTLPVEPGLAWTVSPAVQGCAIAGGELTCDFGTIAGGASKSVHITSPTTAASCGTVDNTGTVTTTNAGSDEASDSTQVDCPVSPNPAIDIEKTGPASATVGDVLAYTLVVKNPGNVPFPAQNVVVTDPRCSQPPVLQSKGADATPGTLDPGDAWTYGCSAETAGLQPGTFVNRATATGTDGDGRVVSDLDDFPTELAAQAVIPGKVVKGTARLSGPSGCVKKAFHATVRGRRIAKVTFYVDGRKAATRTARPGQRTFRYKVRPNGLSRGVHRLTARVRFVPASETKSRTLRLTFQRCKRQDAAPRFTG